MAKQPQPDLKKLELKVSVNCCDGCKRKVKKILLSVEGVLKTEIDPLQPKVTVVGNVDSKILLKRLLKAGKQAELWNNAGKEHDTATTNEKDRQKSELEHLDYCEKQRASNGDAGGIKESKKEDNSRKKSSNTSEAVKCEKQGPKQVEVSDIKYPNLQDLKRNNQYYYKVEPYAVPLPYYTIATYPVPTLCYSHQYEKPMYQPPFQAPVSQVGDYFSDENTVGCYIM